MKGIIAAFAAFIILIVFVALSPFAIVNAGHRGVVTHFGTVSDTILSEGFHWVSPFDSVHEISVQTTKVEAEATAASKDLQTVTATVAVNYHLAPDLVNSLYQSVKGSYEVNIVTPAIQDSVKAATAQFTAEELITKRGEVSDSIKSFLAIKLQPFGAVEGVSITNFDFSDSFNAAIEAKVTAEQDALASKNKLEQTKYEAEQTIVAAQAEAESLRIQAEALSNNQSLVSLEWVRKWNGVLPSTVMGDGAMPLVNLK